MEILYLLVPLAVILAGVSIWGFFWSVKSGQFDDLEGPAHQIIMDDDKITKPPSHGTSRQHRAPRQGKINRP
jgi:cbb3-type cytochrome oxidase maturation protein